MAYRHSLYIGGLICSDIFPSDISIGSDQPRIDCSGLHGAGMCRPGPNGLVEATCQAYKLHCSALVGGLVISAMNGLHLTLLT